MKIDEELECPKVDIIILNWNGWKDTIECLESINRITYTNYDIIIVDNGSENESIEMIREYCNGRVAVNSKLVPEIEGRNNKPIEILEYEREELESEGHKLDDSEKIRNNKLIIIKNEKNYGFAEGNNIAIRYALKSLNPDYLLLLNNDTVVDREFLDYAINAAMSDKKIGIVGPKIYYYDFNGRTDIINFAGGRLDMWKGRSYHIGEDEIDVGQYDKIKIVDFVEGSAFLVKKDALREIGLIDPIYFAYWEEVDFCMRAFKAGYELIYVPESKVWHKISSSVEDRFKIYYISRNRFLFLNKYSTRNQYLSFLIYFFAYQLWFLSFLYLFYKRDPRLFKCFIRGTIDGILITDNKPKHRH